MRKKKLVALALIVFFLFTSTASFATTKTWLVDQAGKEQVKINIVSIGDSIDAGKIRFRQDNETVGLIKEGDKITVTLKNAVFNSLPILENPIQSLNNVAGQTGKFFLIPVEDYSGVTVNSITYELKEKTKEEYGYSYDNIDYVFHFNNLKALDYGNIEVVFSGDMKILSNRGNLITNEPIILAEVVKKNTLEKDQPFSQKEIVKPSFELKEYFNANQEYVIEDGDFKISIPKTFFTSGDNWNFYSGLMANNFLLEIRNYKELEFSNQEFAQSLGLNILEIAPFIQDRLSEKKYSMGGGEHFKDVKVSVLLYLTDNDTIKKIVPIKYVKEEDGSLRKTLLHKGTFNASAREYAFSIDSPGFYSLEMKEVNELSMVIDSKIALVNKKVNNLDVPPMLIANSTYVPVRFIAENLGAQVEFLQATNQVEIKTADKTIYLPIDQVTAELATPARIVDGRTLVPVRYVSEQLGARVSWFADTRTVEIIK